MYSKYGWKAETMTYDKGTWLFGFNFNSNDEWGDNQERYLCIYLFKWQLTIGKYHYTTEKY